MPASINRLRALLLRPMRRQGRATEWTLLCKRHWAWTSNSRTSCHTTTRLISKKECKQTSRLRGYTANLVTKPGGKCLQVRARGSLACMHPERTSSPMQKCRCDSCWRRGCDSQLARFTLRCAVQQLHICFAAAVQTAGAAARVSAATQAWSQTETGSMSTQTH